MNVDPVLVLLQMIPFLLAVVGLWFIIFKPTLKLLEAREQAIVGARKEAEALQARLQAKIDEFEDRLKEANAAGVAERNRLRAETAAREGEIQDAARAEAETLLRVARDRIQAEAQAGRLLLHREAETLGRDIAGAVLGREVSP